MRRFGYARVSTDDQSLDVQREMLTKHGCNVIREEKVSGKSREGRDQLRILLDFIGKGDELVVCKLDRVGRNLLDILTIIEEIEGKGAHLVSLSERFDTTSPMGLACFQVAGVFAQLERSMIRQRQREGIEAAKTRGIYKGGKVRFDPDVIRQKRAEGMRVHQIARMLGCSPDTVARALANR